MILSAIYDKKAVNCNSPSLHHSLDAIKRDIKSYVKTNPDSMLALFPSDYCIVILGNFFPGTSFDCLEQSLLTDYDGYKILEITDILNEV